MGPRVVTGDPSNKDTEEEEDSSTDSSLGNALRIILTLLLFIVLMWIGKNLLTGEQRASEAKPPSELEGEAPLPADPSR